MARLEYNFSDAHLELIRSSGGTDAGVAFQPIPYNNTVFLSANSTGDYVRMSVLDENGTFIRSFYSNLSGSQEPFTEVDYEDIPQSINGASADTTVIANPSGVDIGLEDYPIFSDADTLNQYCVDAGYAGGYESVIETVADMYYAYVGYESIAHWPLAGNADDAIGSLHGTATGTYNWVDDPERGSVMQFVLDGSAKVTVPATSDFNPSTGDLTFVAWSKLDSGFDPTTDPYNYMGIIGRYTDNNHFAILHYNQGKPAFYVRNGPNNAERVELFTVTLGLLNDDQWHHFAGVIEGDTYRLYVDGVEATAPITKAGVHPDLSSDSIDIGNFDSQDSISGYMSDVAAWNRALAEEEISEIYTQGLQYWTLEQGSAQVAASVECNLAGALPTTPYDIDWTTDLEPQLRIYRATTSGNIFVKPNEVLEARDFEAGNYQLMFEFLHNPFDGINVVGDQLGDRTYFYIKEISASRKEIRLITRNGFNEKVDISSSEIDIDGIMKPHDMTGYEYDFILALPRGQNISILNYMIDTISDPNTPSLILKLYRALPTSIGNLTQVTVEREIFTTQTENIWYKTEDHIGPLTGLGLGKDGLLSYEDAS